MLRLSGKFLLFFPIFLLIMVLINSCSDKNSKAIKITADELIMESENDEQSLFLDISKNYPFYNELRKHYDKIELRYIRGEDYANGYGMKYFVLQRLSYYGIKDNDKYFLGYITINGIYDKDSNLLKEVVVPEYTINIGLSSGTLNAPWEPSYALKDTTRKNEIGNTDRAAYLRINFSNNTLEIYQPEY